MHSVCTVNSDTVYCVFYLDNTFPDQVAHVIALSESAAFAYLGAVAVSLIMSGICLVCLFG